LALAPQNCSFRTIKIRGRQPTCPVCGDNPSITELIDYEQFCGARANDKVNQGQTTWFTSYINLNLIITSISNFKSVLFVVENLLK
jgi:hypothetical protein